MLDWRWLLLGTRRERVHARVTARPTAAWGRRRRQEGLDHVLVVHEPHRQTGLQEHVGYCTTGRPHRSLPLLPPRPSARPPHDPGARPGRAIVRPILGGLHHG